MKLTTVLLSPPRLGVASYHFSGRDGDSVDQAWISYEAAPPHWLLDNGDRPPQRKAFDNPTWDSETRTFKGSIDWTETPFSGDSRWEYEMVFAGDFESIVGGQMQGYNADGVASGAPLTFPEQLRYEFYCEEKAQLFHLLTGL